MAFVASLGMRIQTVVYCQAKCLDRTSYLLDVHEAVLLRMEMHEGVDYDTHSVLANSSAPHNWSDLNSSFDSSTASSSET